MERISELNIRAALRYVCEHFELTADYQQGNAALCWRVSFVDKHNAHNQSHELVGLSRREIYNAIHAFRHGMELFENITRSECIALPTTTEG